MKLNVHQIGCRTVKFSHVTDKSVYLTIADSEDTDSFEIDASALYTLRAALKTWHQWRKDGVYKVRTFGGNIAHGKVFVTVLDAALVITLYHSRFGDLPTDWRLVPTVWQVWENNFQDLQIFLDDVLGEVQKKRDSGMKEVDDIPF